MTWVLYSTVGTRSVNLAHAAIDSGSLPYTKATIEEALRLYPPQWLLTRGTARAVDIAGYRVAAGTEVLICPYLMHRNRRWWDGNDGALVLYEARLKSGKTIRNTEYLRFAGEQLRSVEVYFGLGPGERPTTPQAWAAGQKGEQK